MYHNIKKTCALVIALMAMTTANAQSDDFGIWANVEAEKKLGKWSVGLETELRTRDNAGTTDRWSWGLNTSYKLNKYLKFSAGYTLLYDNVDRLTYHDDGSINKEAKFWRIRHRFYASATASYKVDQWTFSLRERWQYTYRPEKTISERYDYDQEDYDGESKTYSGKGHNVLRSRLQVAYSIPKTGLEPYANVELYNSWGIDKVRYTAGMDWDITKHHQVGLYYRYQDESDDEDDNRHILGLSYKFKF
jgi:long-subunit fatty acid transport protein